MASNNFHKHPLQLSNTNSLPSNSPELSSVTCDLCHTHLTLNQLIYSCRPCNFDICLNCFNKTPTKTPTNIPTSTQFPSPEAYISHLEEYISRLESRLESLEKHIHNPYNKRPNPNYKNPFKADFSIYPPNLPYIDDKTPC